MTDRLSIEEAVVVEGRDDRAAVELAVDAAVIETHGFGISAEKWAELEGAYRRCGLIIFTDPDFSGEKIRRRLTERFPDAKQAFLPQAEAEKDGDIGIENASPEAIRAALAAARAVVRSKKGEFCGADLKALNGSEGASELRRKLGAELGIGGGNAAAFLKKLNRLGVTREEFEAACRKCGI